ncbi:MAG: hypothetical protein ACXAEU_07200 [Candidatus Hodarchaeales archaeon]|jgi:predicted nucleic acid-binding protein
MANSKIIVPDSSCLIIFYQLDRLELINRIIEGLGAKLVLLEPVIDELRSVPLEKLEILVHERMDGRNYQQIRNRYRLGKGESAVISYGVENKITVVIDDFKARKVASNLNISITGTMGLLGSGYVLCLVESKKDLEGMFEQSKKIGFRLPDFEQWLANLEKK